MQKAFLRGRHGITIESRPGPCDSEEGGSPGLVVVGLDECEEVEGDYGIVLSAQAGISSRVCCACV